MLTHWLTKLEIGNYALTAIVFFLIPFSSFAAQSTDAVPRSGGELVMSLYATPPHLNPAIQSGLATAIPGTQIFAGLLRFDKEWNPQPYLAEKWEISTDGLSVTLDLVKKAVFHDGTPITSADVAFSIMTVKALHPFKSMMEAVERVDTPDPHTVVIRLKKPHPALLLAMSPALLPILPKHIYGSVEQVKDHPANMQPIGSGPFKLESFVPGKEIRLIKNNDFFIKGRPYLDRLTIKIIRNTLEEGLGMETGDIDMMVSFQDLMELNQLRSLDHLVVIKDGFKGIGPIYWLAFNLQKKPFNDIRVRKAIAYAIDRKFIVDTTFKGEVAIETGPISSTNPFYSPDVNLYEQDFDKANRLLDEAGYSRDKTGKRFSFRITYIPERTGINLHTAEYLREVILRNLGVEVIIEHPRDLNDWIQTVSNWDFDLTVDDVFNWGDPVIGVHRTYLSSNIRKGVIWSNTQGYSNPAADELMEQAASELDFQKRYALYEKFQKIITDDLPIYTLFQPFFAIAYNKNLAGVNESIWGLMTPLDSVYWKLSE
ncbi:MAG: ABC transporter substrate-binding protein [Proteobacteria bacterium]|nr:ABC transporter substrate-binding protein [Pseudomonadota bacterium]MBU1057281.1 ABC transporter substrate-binding protein [Pseudomonadota bacterium]